MELSTVAAKLKNFRKEEEFNEEPLHTKLLTETRDLALKKDRVEGIYSEDKVIYVSHRGERAPVPRTMEVSFAFIRRGETVFLVVMEKKLVANNVANRLSDAIFVTSGYITEAKIPPEVLRDFHERNPENTKVIFFDDVDLPNINKLSLYGSELLNTSLYTDYCSRGKIWYMVMTSRKSGNIVGITRNGVVTIFNSIDKYGYLDYVVDEIFPLVRP